MGDLLYVIIIFIYYMHKKHKEKLVSVRKFIINNFKVNFCPVNFIYFNICNVSNYS